MRGGGEGSARKNQCDGKHERSQAEPGANLVENG